MPARIFRPAKTAMQSGRAKTKEWVLEFEPTTAHRPDPLMGWIQSSDMNSEVQLHFETQDEAVAYAQAHGIAVEVFEPKVHRQIVKAYSDNFATGRKEPWSH